MGFRRYKFLPNIYMYNIYAFIAAAHSPNKTRREKMSDHASHEYSETNRYSSTGTPSNKLAHTPSQVLLKQKIKNKKKRKRPI
jgi:hypothetical protein